MSSAILVALASLDVGNEEHWTTDGQPRMDVMQELTANPNLTRKEVVAVAPEFNRESQKLPEGNSVVMETSDEDESPPDEARPYVEAIASLEGIDPPPLQQFADFLRQVNPEELPALEDYLKEQLQEADQARQRLVELTDRLRKNYALARDHAKRFAPGMSDKEAIRAAIARGQEVRRARVAGAAELGASLGVKVPATALDAAYAARRPNPQGKRPVYPFLRRSDEG